MPAAQPVGQLFWVAVHLGPKFLECKAVDLLVPGQLFQGIFGAGDGIEPEEVDNPGKVTPVDAPAVLPVPDGGGRDTYLLCDIFLIQSEFKSATAQVVAKGDGFTGKFWKSLNFQGNFDFEGGLGCFRKVGKGARIPVPAAISATACTNAVVRRL
jgi:hypothetical protein